MPTPPPSGSRTRTTGTASSTRFARASGTRRSRSPTTRRSSSSASGSPRSSLTDGSPIDPRVRPAYPPDRPAVDAFLAEHDADVVARRGELVDARRHPALIVESDGEIGGVLTWVLRGRSMEVLTLHAARQWAGIGSALIAAARRVAEASGARRLWLITTNDNVDALRFYQRRGFRLARVDAGAVDRSRAALKPAIPEIGDHGIPLRDELELEMAARVVAGAAAGARAPTSCSRSSSPSRVATSPRSPAATRPSSPPTSPRSARAARLWTRAEILEALHADPPDPSISIEAFEVADLGPDLILATL